MEFCPMVVKTYCPTCPFNENGICTYYSTMPLPYTEKTVEEFEDEGD